MIFDVVLLRREGRRRLRSELQQQMPVRGNVTTDNGGARDGLTATLTCDGTAVWRLAQCRITRMAADSLVLAGVESTPDGMLQRQAWWCRAPGPGGPRPFDPDPPSAVTRDASYSPA